MADWDANSPELHRNLQEVGRAVTAGASARASLSSETIRQWQALIMRGLVPGDGEPAGTFRGEPGLEDYDVRIGRHFGAPAADVSAELAGFDRTLNIHLNELDATIPAGHRSRDLTADDVAQRYGLPAFMRVRPRPGDEYERIADRAMVGDWQSAIPLFLRLYEAAL